MRAQQRTIIIFFLLLIASSIASSCGPGQLPAPTFTPAATMTPAATTAPTIQPGDSTRKLTVDGVERDYFIHIPPALDRSQAVPVVFVFHNSTATGPDMVAPTGFNEIADKNNFIVIYPNGIGRDWNSGRCCGSPTKNNVNEAAFVRQILSDLGTMISIDTRRTYATGFSSGALLSYRLACEMSDTFAAVAPVSGALVYSPCEPQQPVSLLHIHGLKDIAVPYAGGGAEVPGGYPSVEKNIATWVQLDGCTGPAQVERQENIFTHTIYASCRDHTAIELYALDLGGHGWPSIYVMPASQIIWDFFAAHPRQ